MIFEWKSPLKAARNFARSCAVWGGMFLGVTGLTSALESMVDEHLLDRGYKAKDVKEIYYRATMGGNLIERDARIFARSYQNHRQMSTGLTGLALGVSLVFLGAAERIDKKDKKKTLPKKIVTSEQLKP